MRHLYEQVAHTVEPVSKYPGLQMQLSDDRVRKLVVPSHAVHVLKAVQLRHVARHVAQATAPV